MKEEFPDVIYAGEKISSNGIDCLDYRNFDTDIEYIKKLISDKEIEELQLIIRDYQKQLSYVNDDIVILKSEIKKLRDALEYVENKIYMDEACELRLKTDYDNIVLEEALEETV